MKLNVINLDGKATGNITLSPAVFELAPRKDLLTRVVNWQLAKMRSGTANTKNRTENSRVKQKFGAQKGSGNARHGARNSNIFVGGATQFGPKPRSFAFALPKKVRVLALKTALSAKAAAKDIIILDAATLKSHKTNALAKKLEKLGLSNATFIVDSMDDNFDRASGNLPFVKVLPTEGANVYDILHQEKLVLTENAVKMLEGRLAGSSKTVSVAQKEAAPKKAVAKPVAKKKAAAPKKAKAASTKKPATKKATTAKKPAAAKAAK